MVFLRLVRDMDKIKEVPKNGLFCTPHPPMCGKVFFLFLSILVEYQTFEIRNTSFLAHSNSIKLAYSTVGELNDTCVIVLVLCGSWHHIPSIKAKTSMPLHFAVGGLAGWISLH